MTTNRTARIFLSSTFRDFGEERDLLVRRVFPALRARLQERFAEDRVLLRGILGGEGPAWLVREAAT